MSRGGRTSTCFDVAQIIIAKKARAQFFLFASQNKTFEIDSESKARMSIERIVLLLLALTPLIQGHTFIFPDGSQLVQAYGINRSASYSVPKSTCVDTGSGCLNLVAELQALRDLLELQQTQIQSLQQQQNQTRGCAWEGLACHCHYSTVATNDVFIVGSNCTNGVLQWTKIMQSVVATSVIGCQFFNLSYCQHFF